MSYRLSSENNKRLCALSFWLSLPKDLLFTKIIEYALVELEETRGLVEMSHTLEEKYKLAEKYKLLED